MKSLYSREVLRKDIITAISNSLHPAAILNQFATEIGPALGISRCTGHMNMNRLQVRDPELLNVLTYILHISIFCICISAISHLYLYLFLFD